MRRVQAGVVVLCLGVATPAAGQSPWPSEYRLEIAAALVRSDGGETESGKSFEPFVPRGNPIRTVLSQFPDRCGHFRTTSDGRIASDAIGGWYVDIVPLNLTGNAMTFDLQWSRARPGALTPRPAEHSVQMTLRPGQSATIDVVPFPRERAQAGRPCDTIATSLRVRAGYWPSRELEDRLVAVDLWLVEKLANGSERSEPLSVRGAANDPLSFFFQPITEAKFGIDLFGQVSVGFVKNALEVRLEPRARIVEETDTRMIAPQGPTAGPRRVDTIFQLKPDEIISVELPAIALKLPDGTVTRQFAIRIRARQIR